MALVFCDSFDHYADTGTKYTTGGGNTDATPGNARTGPRCYANNGPFGASISFSTRTTLIVGIAVNPNNHAATPFREYNAGPTSTVMAQVTINSDGSITVTVGGVNYSSAPALVSLAIYNYIELKVVFAGGVGGSFDAHVNGFTAVSRTGINTDPSAFGGPNTVQLGGQGGGAVTYFDDFYILDGVDASGGAGGKVKNNDFLGPVRIYSEVPIADSAPLQWTPSTGVTHYVLVNEVPPDDDTTYVSDATVGDVDHYLYGITGIPGGVPVLAVQQVIDARLSVTGGARQIGAEINGTVGGNLMALTTSYHMLYQPWDNNPSTALQWTLGDFAALPIGEKVTG